MLSHFLLIRIPLQEAIDHCVELLFNDKLDQAKHRRFYLKLIFNSYVLVLYLSY